MSDELVLDAEPVESGEVIPASDGPTNLFRTDDPGEVLRRAMTTAEALMPVIREKGLIANIQGKDHLQVEAWQTLGAMLGVTAVCVWTRKLDNGWEARVEARTLDGRVIGAAEAECLTSETQWADRDDYAVRSMAQTRATSKALASVLRFVATLGGASGTPAEEMPRGSQGGSKPMSDKQKAFFERLLRESGADSDTQQLIMAYAEDNLTGGRGGSASTAIDGLKDDAQAMVTRLATAAEKWRAELSDVPADDTDLPSVEEAESR